MVGLTKVNLSEKNSVPKITCDFMKFIKSKKPYKKYTILGTKFVLKPFLFPFKSNYSRSTKVLYDALPNLGGKKVLEIGTGSGVLAIIAAKKGATVEAVDILPSAIKVATENVKKNHLEKKVKIYCSDMFSSVRGKFDLIICNLPILNDELPEEDPLWYSLFDPHYNFHKNLFNEGRKYSKNILIAHANLQKNNDFDKLESLAQAFDFEAEIINEINELGYTWRAYLFKQKVKK